MNSSESVDSMEVRAVDNLSFEQLASEAHELRERINRFRAALGHYFVEKQPIIDLMTIAAIAQEPLLLVGPPGTAKSDLILKWRDACQISSEHYFEYMLTRFTEPSEVIGPIDIQQLKEGRYIRRVQGKLPTAHMVFLDEIFKSNSAILNSLLTIINEKKYYQDGIAVPVELRVLFAATNEIPEMTELVALKDRFCLKILCQSVAEEHFLELIDAGLASQAHRELNQRPWAEAHVSLIDFLKAHRYLTMLMSRVETGSDGKTMGDRERYVDAELMNELRRLLKTLVREDGVQVSDRKIIKLYRLLRTRAWLVHGGKVERDDLQMLAYLGETVEELELLQEKVPKLLGLA